MLDIFHIPSQTDNVKIFYTQGATAWQTWTKPRNCKFIWMMCIGGGGGGAAGTNTLGQPGGSGGGSGGVVRALFPANVLPDVLFVQPGPGGSGAQTNSASGGNGNRSWVIINPSGSIPSAMNTVCVSGAAAATGGTFAAGGSAETIATTANASLLSLGNFLAVAGQLAPTANTDVTPLGSTITCAGAPGGAASDTAGPGNGLSIVSTAISPAINGGAVGTGLSGGSGIVSWKPFYTLGGAGGSGTGQAIVAGNGGNGAYGCGGGGGGSCAAGGTFGTGGKGGDGLVIIATF